jgi:hypothetical protein
MRLVAALALGLTLAAASAWAQAPARSPGPPPVAPEDRVPPPPDVRDLGGERYGIGAIVVDRKQGLFTVPGRMIENAEQMPIEFIVTANQGQKSYESLIELNADAYQFNIACILIGLVRRPEEQPQRHFDPRPVAGDSVEVTVEWAVDGVARKEPAARLIRIGRSGKPRDEWVYTGSMVLPNGHYLAHLAGALIGFVHDMDSIIQHRTGLGLGNYGSVTVDRNIAPPPGTQVVLTVRKGTTP